LLSDARVIKTLNEQYNNSWILVQDVEHLKEESKDPKLRQLYETLHKEYEFPVEFFIFNSELALVSKLNANVDTEGERPLSSSNKYTHYLTQHASP
jgi:hypothetical protein